MPSDPGYEDCRNPALQGDTVEARAYRLEDKTCAKHRTPSGKPGDSLGTTVFGGMILATLLGVFLVPVLYVVIQRRRERTHRSEASSEPSSGR